MQQALHFGVDSPPPTSLKIPFFSPKKNAFTPDGQAKLLFCSNQNSQICPLSIHFVGPPSFSRISSSLPPIPRMYSRTFDSGIASQIFVARAIASPVLRGLERRKSFSNSLKRPASRTEVLGDRAGASPSSLTRTEPNPGP